MNALRRAWLHATCWATAAALFAATAHQWFGMALASLGALISLANAWLTPKGPR